MHYATINVDLENLEMTTRCYISIQVAFQFINYLTVIDFVCVNFLFISADVAKPKSLIGYIETKGCITC